MHLIIVNSETQKNSQGEDLISAYLFNERFDKVDELEEIYINGELTPEAQLKFQGYLSNAVFTDDLNKGIDEIVEDQLASQWHYQQLIQSSHYGNVYGN